VLLAAIDDQEEAAALSRHSQRVLVAANNLERLVVDLETGERGFVLTRDESFLEPWTAAQAALPDATRELEGLALVPRQHARAEKITRAARSRSVARSWSNSARSASTLRRPSSGRLLPAGLLAPGRRGDPGRRHLGDQRGHGAPGQGAGAAALYPRASGGRPRACRPAAHWGIISGAGRTSGPSRP
jgi:hypothetical protein